MAFKDIRGISPKAIQQNGYASDRVGLNWGPYVYLTLAPLWERFLLGEGLLLAVNAGIIWALRPDLYTAATQLLLSFLVLSALYSFNDLHDAEKDRKNPKKNQRLVRAFLEHQGDFTVALFAFKAALVLVSWATLGAMPAVAVFAVIGVNTLYSMWAKGVPFLDVFIVGIWGALYCAVVGAPIRVCVLVGAMTSVMHVFQVLVDAEVDKENQIQTTAVFSSWTTTVVLGIICASLSLATGITGGLGWGVSAFLPLLLHLTLSSTEKAWMLSRVYFGVALIVTLGVLHGAA